MASICCFDSLNSLEVAGRYLSAADSRLAPLVAQFDAPTRLIRKPGGAFAALAKSILYQQLAGTAAAAIHARFLAACGAEDDAALRPTAVLAVAEATLRGCGISSAKACYLRDLAAHFADGRLSDEVLLNASSSTAQLHTMLTAVKGIGPWSVTMFEMFFLGNTDILPVGDLGVRKGLAELCGLHSLPSPAEMEALTAPWRPYRSLGCWLMWRIPLPPRQRQQQQNKSAKRRATAAAGDSSGSSSAKASRAAVPDALASAAAGSAVASTCPPVDSGLVVPVTPEKHPETPQTRLRNKRLQAHVAGRQHRAGSAASSTAGGAEGASASRTPQARDVDL